MTNRFNPATEAADITPNDSTVLARPPRSLYIGGSGDLKVDMQDGGTVTFASVPVGILPVCVSRVYATGTTTSSIVGLY